MERNILCVEVKDRIAKCLNDRWNLHSLPPEMTWIEIYSDLWPYGLT
jgi:hypothetical protein